MKQKRIVTIFTAIIVSNQIFCMEKENQIEKITQAGMTVFMTQNNGYGYKNLELALKRQLITIDSVKYNTAQPEWQYSTLKRFIKKGDLESLHLCLEHKLNPNGYLNKLSLLHYAIKCHKDAAITMLSRYNPDLMPLNKEQQTPLDYAISLECQPCIDAMADAIAIKINQLLIYQKKCVLDHSIVATEFYEECLDLIWLLRWYKLKGNFPYASLETLLSHSIVKENDKEYTSVPSDMQYRILKHCIKHDDMGFLTLYLTYKFNPNRYRKQISLLHYAIEHHKPKAITILAQYNPDLTPLNPQEETPLDYAENLQCKKCINAMATIIRRKCNQLEMYDKHCELLKHSTSRKYPCLLCLEELKKQLQRYNLSYRSVDAADLEEIIIDSQL